MKKVLAVLLMGLGVILVGDAGYAKAMGGGKTTGTYSDLCYNTEGGDLLGTEVRIVVGNGGKLQGTIQIAEGGITDLGLFDIQKSGEALVFEVTLKNYEGKFIGRLENGALVGKLAFKSGGVMDLKLPRKKSYWD